MGLVGQEENCKEKHRAECIQAARNLRRPSGPSPPRGHQHPHLQPASEAADKLAPFPFQVQRRTGVGDFADRIVLAALRPFLDIVAIAKDGTVYLAGVGAVQDVVDE